jgi:hypothetical protein
MYRFCQAIWRVFMAVLRFVRVALSRGGDVLLLLNLDILGSAYKVEQVSWIFQNARRLIHAV